MTEFQRLIESSPSTLTRELLGSGLSDHSPPGAAERAAIALGVAAMFSASSALGAAGGSVAVGAGAASAGTAGVLGSGVAALLGSASLAKLFAIGIVSGAVVAGGSALVSREFAGSDAGAREGSAKHAAVENVRTPAVAPAAVDTRRTSDENDAASSDGLGPPAPATATALAVRPSIGRSESLTSGTAGHGAVHSGEQRPPSKNPIHPPETSVGALPIEGGALAREVERIDRARDAVNGKQGERALSELAAYERERSTGTLDREALLIRIDALLLLGDRNRALALARSYLARFPKDAHEARLRSLENGH